jgi:RimJ/RimL family protein N-acetyltransferase
MDLSPTVLTGRHVRLEPLAERHADDLVGVALDEQLWRWTATQVRSRAELDAYIATALQWQRDDTALPFATVDLASGRAIGSTRLANADHANRRVEIGWSWLGRAFQRTALNTEAKLLMLAHAFGPLDCIRVELKTDALNERSRSAIRRLGAAEEGTLRHHMITSTGRMRDSVYYSILRDEWPAVHDGLVAKLAAGPGSAAANA